jgi:hypothetical protein
MDLLQNFLSYSKKSLSSVSLNPTNLRDQHIDFFKSPGARLRRVFFNGLFPIIILFIITSSGCIKNDCDDCYTPPEDFGMKIVDKDTGENLLDGKTYFPDSIEIYYLQNELKKNVFIQIIETNAHENIVESTNIAWLSVGGESKTFYIQLNSQDTDTLYLNVIEYLYYCCRSFPYESVLINGVEMENPYPGMYLLQK